jgi:phosphoribosylamine--glycine ligase
VICGAGLAAHLAGVVAAQCDIPVIGVPIDAGALRGLDALLSTVQMPPGIPVATMGIGKPGARNAGIMAVKILALGNSELDQKLKQFRKGLASKVEEMNKKLPRKFKS